MAIKYTKWPQNIPYDYKLDQMALKYIYQYLLFKDYTKFTQTGIIPSGNTDHSRVRKYLKQRVQLCCVSRTLPVMTKVCSRQFPKKWFSLWNVPPLVDLSSFLHLQLNFVLKRLHLWVVQH
jgi:hypothetical protein